MFHNQRQSRTPAPPRCEPLEPRRLLSAGDLDTSFNGIGKATVDFGTGATSLGVTVQPDGKTVVVGGTDGFKGFAVARFNVDGTPDLSFGPDHSGKLLTPFSDRGEAHAVALQSDGKIVVVGIQGEADLRMGVVRYNPDGTLDRTFDGDGKKNIDFSTFGNDSDATCVTIQAGDKILVGGTHVTGLIDTNDDFALVRLNPDGSFDNSFDGDGKRIVGFGDWETVTALATDYSGTPATNPHYGTIVAVGNKQDLDVTYSEIAVARLNDNGSLDPSFDGDGEKILRYGNFRTTARSVVIQSDGKLVISGTAGDDLAMVRLFHNGVLDAAFGTGGSGWQIEDLGGIERGGILIQKNDGELLLAGTSLHGQVGQPLAQDSLFVAYSPDARRDPAFGANGVATGPAPGVADVAAGPGRRFVATFGAAFRTARFLDFGANLVYATTLNQTASEAGPTSRGFFVYRVDRAPFATRVYFNVGGTASAPTLLNFRTRDYTLDGMTFPDPFGGGSDVPYAEIPADQTFTVVTLTPIDDTRVEGNETATFTILPASGYEVGNPSGASFTIVDNDAPPPSVAQVYVRGSAWRGPDDNDANTTFKEYLAAKSLGDADYGYRVDTIPADAILPWTNLDQFVLRYEAPPTGSAIPSTGGVVLDGARSDYTVGSVQKLDARTFLLTLDRPLGTTAAGDGEGDQIRLAVPGGAAGALYRLRFNVLPGDVTRSGAVLADDFSDVKKRFFKSTNTPATGGASDYTPFADVDASGSVLATDFSEVKKRFFDNLPPTAAAALASAPTVRQDLLGAPSLLD